MKTNSLFSVRTALATAVAGAVFVFAGCGDGEGTQGTEKTQGTTHADGAVGSRVPRDRRGDDGAGGLRLIPDASERSRGTRDPTDAAWPEATARFLVENAVNDSNYENLAKLRDMVDKIADPALRLRLLEGLAWFDETAVADALPFLADPDAEVASAAGEIITSRISTIPRTSQREQVYKAALTLMADDSPDREILMATLENDKKTACINLLHDFESQRETRPELWKRLTEVYEAQFGRPYKDHLDALLHYNPRDDR